MKCVICEVRKPRRFCPGVHGEICTLCCGTERENTVSCPLDCIYLREARTREKPLELDPAAIPFSDIRVPPQLLEERPEIGMMAMASLAVAVASTGGAIDYDVREALDALIRTSKTLQSGLVYDTRPVNPVAAAIYDRLQEGIEKGRKDIAARTGTSVRDADILGMLVVLHRLEYRYNNGRKRGRAYIDYLVQHFPMRAEANPPASPLIV
jgi:hypothetical protein